MWRKCAGVGLAAVLAVVAVPLATHAASGPAYASSWSRGLSGWAHSSSGWTVSGGVVSYNGSSASVLIAPYRVHRSTYTVQASMRLMAWRETGLSESHGMGILIRSRGPVDPTGDTAGIMAGLGKGFVGCDGVHSNALVASADTDLTPVAQDSRAFSAGHNWHTVRVEVKGTAIKLIIDGKVRTTAKTAKFTGASAVGLFSLSAHMEIKNFSVRAL
jgi:hypothetical protein